MRVAEFVDERVFVPSAELVPLTIVYGFLETDELIPPLFIKVDLVSAFTGFPTLEFAEEYE